jgi:hypothetical protein
VEGCPPIPNLSDKAHPYCNGFVKTVQKLIADPYINKVVIGATWLGRLNSHYYYYQNKGGRCHVFDCKELVYLELEGMIRSLIKKRKKVYLILSVPSGSEYDPRTFIKRNLWGNMIYHIPYADAKSWHAHSKEINKNLRRLP